MSWDDPPAPPVRKGGTMTESNIEVLLTDENEFHCFKIVFRAEPGAPDQPDRERIPLEVYLHATQAIALFTKLAEKLAEYMHRESGELLRIKAGMPR